MLYLWNLLLKSPKWSLRLPKEIALFLKWLFVLKHHSEVFLELASENFMARPKALFITNAKGVMIYANLPYQEGVKISLNFVGVHEASIDCSWLWSTCGLALSYNLTCLTFLVVQWSCVSSLSLFSSIQFSEQVCSNWWQRFNAIVCVLMHDYAVSFEAKVMLFWMGSTSSYLLMWWDRGPRSSFWGLFVKILFWFALFPNWFRIEMK